jgi:hypothetical protein
MSWFLPGDAAPTTPRGTAAKVSNLNHLMRPANAIYHFEAQGCLVLGKIGLGAN